MGDDDDDDAVPVEWGERRFLVTVNGDDMSVKPLGNAHRYKQQIKGVRRRPFFKNDKSEFMLDNEYVVWAKDELDAFVKVTKMRSAGAVNPFGKNNIFDA